MDSKTDIERVGRVLRLILFIADLNVETTNINLHSVGESYYSSTLGLTNHGAH